MAQVSDRQAPIGAAIGEYCAYSHFAQMLKRTGKEWLIAMFAFEAYFDDSGTDPVSDIAIAACYISTLRGWNEFVNAWDRARREEDFDEFHMAHFVAPQEQGKKPFCDWDDTKKKRVYKRLATIINENKSVGIAIAVPKAVYDNIVPEKIRNSHGNDHYTFAISKCMAIIARWQESRGVIHPIEMVFDWESKDSNKRIEVTRLFETMDDSIKQKIGLRGYSFQHKSDYKPLQASDILAWQMNYHMRRIWPGPDEIGREHEGFRILREDQVMELAFLTEKNLKDWVKKIEDWEREHGEFDFWIPRKQDMNER
jgi:Protein of unknown function (DUF3800)